MGAHHAALPAAGARRDGRSDPARRARAWDRADDPASGTDTARAPTPRIARAWSSTSTVTRRTRSSRACGSDLFHPSSRLSPASGSNGCCPPRRSSRRRCRESRLSLHAVLLATERKSRPSSVVPRRRSVRSSPGSRADWSGMASLTPAPWQVFTRSPSLAGCSDKPGGSWRVHRAPGAAGEKLSFRRHRFHVC